MVNVFDFEGMRKAAQERQAQGELELASRELKAALEDKSRSPREVLFDVKMSIFRIGKLKDQFLGDWQAAAVDIGTHADRIRSCLAEELVRMRIRDRKLANESALNLLVALRRFNPEEFPVDLVDLTDKESEELAEPVDRLVYDGLFRAAKLAEFDPIRFKKIFVDKHLVEQLAVQRQKWSEWDQGLDARQSDEPRCLPEWLKIERALIA